MVDISVGKFLQSLSTGVIIFFSIILWYFSYLLFALIPYHGNHPLNKYIITYPTPSKSSLRDYSIPRCALTLAYLAVPVKFLFSR